MKIAKVEKLVTNSHDKIEYVIHIRNLKQTSNHGLILKKVHRVIEFNQKAWLRPYIEMNTKLREKAKNNFEKDFFKFMNAVFREIMENVSKHRNIKLVSKLSSGKVFTRKFISNGNQKNSNTYG